MVVWPLLTKLFRLWLKGMKTLSELASSMAQKCTTYDGTKRSPFHWRPLLFFFSLIQARYHPWQRRWGRKKLTDYCWSAEKAKNYSFHLLPKTRNLLQKKDGTTYCTTVRRTVYYVFLLLLVIVIAHCFFLPPFWYQDRKSWRLLAGENDERTNDNDLSWLMSTQSAKSAPSFLLVLLLHPLPSSTSTLQ